MQDLSSTQYFKVEKAPELKIGDVLEIVCPEIRHILQVI